MGSNSSVDLSTKNLDEVKSLIKSKHPELTNGQIDGIIKEGIKNGKDEFWVEYNLPFLKQAFERGDDIRLASDPAIYSQSEDLGGFYKKELDAISGPNGFANQYGYTYNSTTKTYIKE